MGRSKLHEVANFFNLSHHSRGRKDNVNGKKRRRAVLYPKTLFIEKQQQERTRLLKERQSIRDKYKSRDMLTGIMPDVPSTFTEMCLREIYEERF